MTHSVMPWHPWPVDRSWPSTAADEQRFVAELAEAAASRSGAPEGYQRADVTAVVTALRNGATARDVLEWAAGLHPACLLAAYNDLERRRATAEAAWVALSISPTTSALTEYGPQAALLLPAAIAKLTRVMRSTGGAGLALAAAKVQATLDRAAHEVGAIERELAHEDDPERSTSIGRQLFMPHRECYYNEPLFLPSRVGQLSPQRVANLLAEQPEHLGAALGDVED